MHVIAVGDIVLVGHTLDDAEALLQTLGELVGGGLQRRTVYGIADVLCRLPFITLIIQLLHHRETEGLALLCGVGYAQHPHAHLIKTRIAQRNGGIVVEEKLVDDLALLQPRQRTVLPEDRCHIADGAQKALMPQPQCPVTELQALLQKLPEAVHVALGGAGHIHQVDGHHALIEAAVVLVLSVLAHAHGILGQEGAAAHAGIHISALVLPHDLCGNVIGHHTLRGALRCQLREAPVLGALVDIVLVQHIDQLREGRCDPYPLLILHALHSLQQHLPDDGRQVISGLSLRHLIEVHEHGHEGSLAVTGHEGDELILNGLDTALDLLGKPALHHLVNDGLVQGLTALCPLLDDLLPDLLPGHIHKGCQMRQGEGLSAILVAGHLRHDLGGDVAGGEEAVGLLDHGLGNDGAVLQHVLQVDEVTVVLLLGEVVGIVEMNDALLVGLHDVLRQQQTLGEIPGYLAGHIVTLGGIDHRVLVGVLLLQLLIGLVDERQDILIGGVRLSGDLPLEAIAHILLCHLVAPHLHDAGLHHILNVLYIHRMGRACHLLGHRICNTQDLILVHPVDGLHLLIGLSDRIGDLREVELHLLAVSLDDVDLYLNIIFHVQALRFPIYSNLAYL